MNIEEAHQLWKQLDDACTLIAIHQTKQLSYQDLYNAAYKLALNRHGDLAYAKLQDSLSRIFDKLISPLSLLIDDQLLREFVKAYDEMQYISKLISDIFLYMEKTFCLMKQLKTIKQLCNETFKKKLFEEDQNLSNKLLNCFLGQIRNDRNGLLIEHFKLRNALQILVNLIQKQIDINQEQNIKSTQSYTYTVDYTVNEAFYKNYFERKLLQDSNRQFKDESQQNISQLSIEEYVLFLEQRLHAEDQRVKSYIPRSSHNKVMECFIKNYITLNAVYLSGGLYHFIENEKTEIIIKTFQLFVKSDEAFALFIQTLSQYTSDHIIQLNQNEHTLIGLMNLYDQMFRLYNNIAEYSTNDQMYQCQKAIKSIEFFYLDSFEQAINRDNFILIELNKFFDGLMKREALNENEVKLQIERGMAIFRLIQSKDEFEHIYRKFLCLRLLDQTYNSIDQEKTMVSKFKLECGSVLTHKMETMFGDLIRSNQESQEFKSTQREGIDFEIQVLTSEQWPLQDSQQFIIHNELQFWQDQYEQYYMGKNQKRKLAFNYGLGFVNLRATFDQVNKKEFICSVLQGTILMHFNSCRVISIVDLLKWTKVDQNQFNSELEPLLGFKLLILNENSLSLNQKFQNRSYKIKLQPKKPHILVGQKRKGETQIDQKEIILDRRVYLESLIVRVLKTKKQLDHKELFKYIEKDAKSRHFQIDVPFFKECIENLISKEYLIRSDLDTYIYKA